MDYSWALLALLAALAFISKLLFNQLRPEIKLPPGPKPWLVIGNLNLMMGSIPHQSLHSLSQKYGQIMLLRFGKFPVVVASSPDMAKHFLQTHDTVFASRPPLAAGKNTSYSYMDMLFAPYGPRWRQARKIVTSELLTSKRLDSLERIRVEEGHGFLTHLFSLLGQPVMLRDHLFRYMLSSINRMVLGNTYFSEKENEKESVLSLDELKGMLDEWSLLHGVFNIGNWISWLSFLDLLLQGYVKRMEAVNNKLDRFLSYVIDDRRARMVVEKEFVSKYMLDVLVQRAEDPNPDVKLPSDSVKGLLLDLLLGATDPAATTVEWTIQELLKQPHIITKAKKELNSVIGRNRWVKENDFSGLPYIDAIIMESMRLHPPATLLAPHYSMEDCNVSGYDVPKGSMVLINAWSIGRDPNTWDAPEIFSPERFLGKETDIMFGSNFTLLPFGSGRRRCPGYNLGLKIVRTTLANLIHGFALRLVEGMRPEDICMEEEYGLITHPKNPVAIIMEPTLPRHLY